MTVIPLFVLCLFKHVNRCRLHRPFNVSTWPQSGFISVMDWGISSLDRVLATFWILCLVSLTSVCFLAGCLYDYYYVLNTNFMYYSCHCELLFAVFDPLSPAFRCRALLDFACLYLLLCSQCVFFGGPVGLAGAISIMFIMFLIQMIAIVKL